MVMRMPNSTLGSPVAKRKSIVERIDVAAADEARAEAGQADKPGRIADAGEENCPVIRASQIMFSSAITGRLKIIFF
jgi:hypothetical protein